MSTITFEIIVFAFSILFTYFLLRKVIPYLSLDIPNLRSAHSSPTYRGGGIVFILVSFLTIPITKFYSLITILPLIIIGYLDDLLTISSKWRFVIQCFTVFLILQSSLDLPISNIFIYLIFLFGGVALINFTNFMDGIDAMLASNMIISLAHLTILNHNSNLYPLIGGLIAFLFFNKSPAKVFMGDVGSTFLGAILFLEVIKLSNFKVAFLSISAAFPLYLDALTCIIARLYNKENIFLSHKKHLYQRLVSNGLNHNKVTLIYCLCSILICLSCYTNNIPLVFIVLTLVSLTGVFLNKFFAVAFLDNSK